MHQNISDEPGTEAKKDLETQQPPEWECIRSKGRIRYTLVQGGLLALIVILWIYIWRFVTAGSASMPELSVILFEIAIALCISLPVYAFVMWPLNEWFYTRKKKADTSAA